MWHDDGSPSPTRVFDYSYYSSHRRGRGLGLDLGFGLVTDVDVGHRRHRLDRRDPHLARLHLRAGPAQRRLAGDPHRQGGHGRQGLPDDRAARHRLRVRGVQPDVRGAVRRPPVRLGPDRSADDGLPAEHRRARSPFETKGRFLLLSTRRIDPIEMPALLNLADEFVRRVPPAVRELYETFPDGAGTDVFPLGGVGANGRTGRPSPRPGPAAGWARATAGRSLRDRGRLVGSHARRRPRPRRPRGPAVAEDPWHDRPAARPRPVATLIRRAPPRLRDVGRDDRRGHHRRGPGRVRGRHHAGPARARRHGRRQGHLPARQVLRRRPDRRGAAPARGPGARPGRRCRRGTRSTDVWVRSPGGRDVRFPLPHGPGLFAVVARRRELDAALVDLARRAGATVLEGHRLVGARQRADQRAARASTSAGGEPHDGRRPVRDRGRRHVVAAATPPRARHARATAASGTRSASTCATCRRPRPATCGCSFEPDLLPGYFWSFPVGDGDANIGFGIVRGGRVTPHDMKRALARPAGPARTSGRCSGPTPSPRRRTGPGPSPPASTTSCWPTAGSCSSATPPPPPTP